MRLSNEIKELIIENFEEEGAVKVSVFGSYASGDADEESDLDILAEFSSPKSLMEVSRIERRLSESIGIEVDLVTPGSLSPYIKDRIEEEVLFA